MVQTHKMDSKPIIHISQTKLDWFIESRKNTEINTILSTDSYCPVTAKVNGHGMSKVLRLLLGKILKDTYFTRPGEVAVSKNMCPGRKQKQIFVFMPGAKKNKACRRKGFSDQQS